MENEDTISDEEIERDIEKSFGIEGTLDEIEREARSRPDSEEWSFIDKEGRSIK